MEAFTDFVSNVAGTATGSFESLFGVQAADPDGWLKEKGRALGREVMAKLLESLCKENGVEPAPDAVRSRSRGPEDVVANSGLGSGSVAAFLAPLVAGLVSALNESDVKRGVLDFASKKAVAAVQEHATALSEQGESLGAHLVEGLAHGAAPAGAGPATGEPPDAHAHATPLAPSAPSAPSAAGVPHGKGAVRRGGKAEGRVARGVAEPLLPGDEPRRAQPRSAAPRAAAATEPPIVQSVRSAGFGADIMAAVVTPLATGLTRAFADTDLLGRLGHAVLGRVPVDTVKEALKSVLYPQYVTACRAVEPQMVSFGDVAGKHIVDFLSSLGESEEPSEEAQRDVARTIAGDSSSVDSHLLAPLLAPFLTGVIRVLCEAGWKMELAAGLLKRLCGACCGGGGGGGGGGTTLRVVGGRRT